MPFKAKTYKDKQFVKSKFLDLNWHLNSSVWGEYTYYVFIQVHNRFMYTFYTKQTVSTEL